MILPDIKIAADNSISDDQILRIAQFVQLVQPECLKLIRKRSEWL